MTRTPTQIIKSLRNLKKLRNRKLTKKAKLLSDLS